uniref:ATP-dependent helicase brm n=1 Tax=Anthurium amnicola TaxID=1678845 RepID=A0A1D1YP73_9ARAE
MNRNLIFAFVLLATLFMVNAVPYVHLKRKEKVTFEHCKVQGNPELITVQVSPNPPVSNESEQFYVSGVLENGAITAYETVLEIRFIFNGVPLINDYVQEFTESFPAGEPFQITALKVPTPKKLPESYEIEVIIGNPIPIQEELIKILGCASADVNNT